MKVLTGPITMNLEDGEDAYWNKMQQITGNKTFYGPL